jgi:hypothetical protein
VAAVDRLILRRLVGEARGDEARVGDGVGHPAGRVFGAATRGAEEETRKRKRVKRSGNTGRAARALPYRTGRGVSKTIGNFFSTPGSTAETPRLGGEKKSGPGDRSPGPHAERCVRNAHLNAFSPVTA